jgi:hypothetical protein
MRSSWLVSGGAARRHTRHDNASHGNDGGERRHDVLSRHTGASRNASSSYLARWIMNRSDFSATGARQAN